MLRPRCRRAQCRAGAEEAQSGELLQRRVATPSVWPVGSVFACRMYRSLGVRFPGTGGKAREIVGQLPLARRRAARHLRRKHTTSWRPSSSAPPSRRSCGPILPSSPRPSWTGASLRPVGGHAVRYCLLLRGRHGPALPFRLRLGFALGDGSLPPRGAPRRRACRRCGRSKHLLDVGQRLDLGLEAVYFTLAVSNCLCDVTHGPWRLLACPQDVNSLGVDARFAEGGPRGTVHGVRRRGDGRRGITGTGVL